MHHSVLQLHQLDVKKPVVVEDVDTKVDELVGEEGVGDKELTDGDDDVEQLAEEEHVGVRVELVVDKL